MSCVLQTLMLSLASTFLLINSEHSFDSNFVIPCLHQAQPLQTHLSCCQKQCKCMEYCTSEIEWGIRLLSGTHHTSHTDYNVFYQLLLHCTAHFQCILIVRLNESVALTVCIQRNHRLNQVSSQPPYNSFAFTVWEEQQSHGGFSTLQQLIEQQSCSSEQERRGDENRLINNEGRVRLSAKASLRC